MESFRGSRVPPVKLDLHNNDWVSGSLVVECGTQNDDRWDMHGVHMSLAMWLSATLRFGPQVQTQQC
jgi:hypothetical protein